MSNRYESKNICHLTKFIPEGIITTVYQEGSTKAFFIKRFKIETVKTQKSFFFISETKNSKLYFVSDAVKVEAIFENDTESCDSDKCLIKQEQSLNIPDYLFSEVEQYVVKELAMTLQVPTDGADDGQNTLR